MFDAESFWEGILSEDTELIRQTFATLPNEDERESVLQHLHKMVTETGWSEPQQVAAATALEALKSPDSK